MKTILFLVLSAVAVHAQNPTATITEETKMELTKGKGSVLLKAGTAVDVVSRDGDSITIVNHKIQGRVPVAKTDFKGVAPEAAAQAAKDEPKTSAPAPTNPPAQAKSAEGASLSSPSPWNCVARKWPPSTKRKSSPKVLCPHPLRVRS